jgi:phenylacetate-coenzyme A ligase PaaK-like adenylate-forming protein
MAAVMAAAPIHVSGFASAVLTGPPVRLLSAPATLPLDELVERLNDLQPPALMGYPSKLVLLAREQRTGRLGIAPRVITSTSETLIPEDRDAIRAAFGAPVVDQFATTEGLVGHSAPDDSVLTFASDMCIAELVDADNQPVPEGTPSAKVLVTNLHNFTQPLIRYELTDRFVRHPGDGPLRATVEGRADEVFRYDSVEVHPHAIRTELVMAPAVREYQVHQTERGAHVAVVADGELDPDALATAIARNLRRAGVPDPHVTVRRVDAVPCHPQTGKVTRFIALTRR